MNLLFTDFETTGLDPERHEIIDVGGIVCDSDTMDISSSFGCLVKPEHIENADPVALAVNGYNEADWAEAVPLKAAMSLYADNSSGAVFTAQNVVFDYGFYLAGLKKLGLKNNMNYHRLDVGSMAFAFIQPYVLSLDKLCLILGIQPEPAPHRAINGARKEYELVRKLRLMGQSGLSIVNPDCRIAEV